MRDDRDFVPLVLMAAALILTFVTALVVAH